MDENFEHPGPGPSGGPSLPPGATDTHELTYMSQEGRKPEMSREGSKSPRPKMSDVGGAYNNYTPPKLNDVGGAYNSRLR